MPEAALRHVQSSPTDPEAIVGDAGPREASEATQARVAEKAKEAPLSDRL